MRRPLLAAVWNHATPYTRELRLPPHTDSIFAKLRQCTLSIYAIFAVCPKAGLSFLTRGCRRLRASKRYCSVSSCAFVQGVKMQKPKNDPQTAEPVFCAGPARTCRHFERNERRYTAALASAGTFAFGRVKCATSGRASVSASPLRLVEVLLLADEFFEGDGNGALQNGVVLPNTERPNKGRAWPRTGSSWMGRVCCVFALRFSR